jgi:hypothetical protein
MLTKVRSSACRVCMIQTPRRIPVSGGYNIGAASTGILHNKFNQ